MYNTCNHVGISVCSPVPKHFAKTAISQAVTASGSLRVVTTPLSCLKAFSVFPHSLLNTHKDYVDHRPSHPPQRTAAHRNTLQHTTIHTQHRAFDPPENTHDSGNTQRKHSRKLTYTDL